MRALVKKFKEKGLWLDEIPEPKVGPGDVLIKIVQTSICGSDVHIYNWDEWAAKTIPVPMQVGHEFMGVIEKLGTSVTGLSIGQRVSGEGHLFCGTCRNCRAGQRHLCIHTQGVGISRPGCFAEYLCIPAVNVFPIPDGVSDDEATVLDPFGNAVHTALSFDLVGEDVLVTGAGPIGILSAGIAKHVGARHVVITDINEHRLNLAQSLGLKNAVHPGQTPLKEVMKKLKMTEGFDVGLEMSGSAHAFKEMIASVKNGAKIALLGILPNDTLIPWDQVIFKGLHIKGVHGREIFETWYKMCSLLQSGLNIKPIFTHRYPYTEFQKGFDAMFSGRAGKVILEWREP